MTPEKEIEFNKEVTAVTMKYIDRIGDYCDVDPAEKICDEFYKSFSVVFNKYYDSLNSTYK